MRANGLCIALGSANGLWIALGSANGLWIVLAHDQVFRPGAVSYTPGMLHAAHPCALQGGSVPGRDRPEVTRHEPTRHLGLSRGAAFHHHDPFDRRLVAQAMEEKIPLVTKAVTV